MSFKPPFKNREHAALLLSQKLKTWLETKKLKPKNVVILSLLRGGWPIGKVISTELKLKHLPIVAAKIGAPFNEEVAAGAICFDAVYLNQAVIQKLRYYLTDQELDLTLRTQLEKAKTKADSYQKLFKLDPKKIKEQVKGQVAVIVDDGVATGATAKAASYFLKAGEAKQVVLAAPVAPADLDCSEFDDCVILVKDPAFQAVGQYYQDFSEVKVESLINS